MNRDSHRMAYNTLDGLAMAALLFFGGLFLTIWSWGAASPLGVPLMMAGICVPFLQAFMARHGESSWAGGRDGRGHSRQARSS
jgi:hypothetical protein